MDGRTAYFMQLAASLIASGAAQYRNSSIGQVTSELIAEADVLDEFFHERDVGGCDDCSTKGTQH